jgi:hypothetical protein
LNDNLRNLPTLTAVSTTEPSPDGIWRTPAHQLLVQLATKVDGLNGAEAQSRLSTYGTNDVSSVKRSPLWLQFSLVSAIHWSLSCLWRADFPR